MKIKEVEQSLEVPRATIRYYEKEGLLAPTREGNAYRNYSDDDVEKLKKIIILRKIGIPVEEIHDLFDGVKPMNEVLETNIENLQNQMGELQRALRLSQKMIDDTVEFSSMDVNAYWNRIEDEERQGNTFIDIAKDIAKVEKGVFVSYFLYTDQNGELYDNLPKCIRNVLLCVILSGVVFCILEGSWTLAAFLRGPLTICTFMIIEMIISIPLYFLGKKYEWIRKNRNIGVFIAIMIAIVLLAIIENIVH